MTLKKLCKLTVGILSVATFAVVMMPSKAMADDGIVCRVMPDGNVICEDVRTNASDGIVCRVLPDGDVVCEKVTDTQ